jgi:hypothetical protein
MPKLKINVKTDFCYIEVSGESPKELIEGLSWLDSDFLSEIKGRINEIESFQDKDALANIVRVGKDGPIIVTLEEISHYEAIGLILYAMSKEGAKTGEVRKRLAESGKDVTVAARLHEMGKRGHVFQPLGKGTEYKLTALGNKWIEEEVLPKIREEK